MKSRRKFLKIWEIVSIYFGTSLQVKFSTLSWLRKKNAAEYFLVNRLIL